MTEILPYAFSGAKYLERIDIPASVKVISAHAFENCGKLRSLEIGRTVEIIESDAVILPETTVYVEHSYKPLGWDDHWTSQNKAIIWNASANNDSGFLYDERSSGLWIIGYVGKSNEIEIPDSINNIPVIGIGERAFENQPIKSVFIPSTVKFIDAGAFSGCTSLEEAEFEDRNAHFEIDDVEPYYVATAIENAKALTEDYVSKSWKKN